MKRTISSFRPLGAVSASMSVTKPYLYLSSARTCSTVSRLAAIQLLSCMHECFCRILPAATALLPLLLADGFIHARANLLADLAGQAEARQHHHLRAAERAQGLADGVVPLVQVAAHPAVGFGPAAVVRAVDAGGLRARHRQEERRVGAEC